MPGGIMALLSPCRFLIPVLLLTLASFPAVQAADSTVDIVADGLSCRQQIQHATGRQARHMVEVLWEAVALRNGNG